MELLVRILVGPRYPGVMGAVIGAARRRAEDVKILLRSGTRRLPGARAGAR